MDEAFEVFSATLSTALARWGMAISPGQLERLCTHYQAMIEANRTMNLTRIIDPEEAAVKHYADSLALLTWVEKRKVEVRTVLDIGTGAGFPAIPLAVVRPEWSVTAIDARRKKIDFVRRAAKDIGLTNLKCEHAHSRHWTIPGPGFDLVVFRALTSLAGSLEQSAGYVEQGGRVVAYKTASIEPAEQAAAKRAVSKLRLQPEEEFTYGLTTENNWFDRALYVYRKSG